MRLIPAPALAQARRNNAAKIEILAMLNKVRKSASGSSVVGDGDGGGGGASTGSGIPGGVIA